MAVSLNNARAMVDIERNDQARTCKTTTQVPTDTLAARAIALDRHHAAVPEQGRHGAWTGQRRITFFRFRRHDPGDHHPLEADNGLALKPTRCRSFHIGVGRHRVAMIEDGGRRQEIATRGQVMLCRDTPSQLAR